MKIRWRRFILSHSKKIHSLSFSLPRGDQTADSTREEASCRKKHNAFRKHLLDEDAGDAKDEHDLNDITCLLFLLSKWGIKHASINTILSLFTQGRSREEAQNPISFFRNMLSHVTEAIVAMCVYYAV